MYLRAYRAWQIILDISCLFICGRFITATLHASGRDVASLSVYILGVVTISVFRPIEVFVAIIALLSFISGAGTTHILPTADPVALTFSAALFGVICRRTGLPFSKATRIDWVNIALKLLISGVIISLLCAICGSAKTTLNNPHLWTVPVFGYAESLYSTTTSLIWVQGLFLLEALYTEHRFNTRNLQATFAVLIIGSFTFFLAQALTGYPAPWSAELKHFSPYDDIHAFGSIIVALFAYSLAEIGNTCGKVDRLRAIGWLALTTVMLVYSYSRAAWLVGMVIVIIYISVRYRAKYVLVVLSAALIALALSWTQLNRIENIYVKRGLSLIRLESIEKKSPERIALYHRGLAMIESEPITGIGIGKFYASSTRFAGPSDEIREIPNFAHNAVLQFTAEMGLPMGLLFAGLWLSLVVRGLLNVKNGRGHLPLLLAALAFSMTEMTSNGINIYSSQQIFFAFLLGAVAQPYTSLKSESDQTSYKQ